MFGIKFVGFPASIMFFCYMYLIATFKILVIEYQPIYQISEFNPNPNIGILASAPKVPY